MIILSTKIVNGAVLANVPWEERPDGSSDVVWRYSQNPIIPRNLTPRSNSIFNSAAVAFENSFAGVFRVDDTRRLMNLHVGRSTDGINWQIEPDRIEWKFDDAELSHFLHRYDPRVT